MVLSIDEMYTFCKKKGFVYPSAEVYGGLAGFYDFGHLGVELKNRIKNKLWKEFVQKRIDVVGIDGSIITNPKVWQASGHLSSFTDVLMTCSKCKSRFRGDQLIEEKLKVSAEGISKEEIDRKVKEDRITCPKCGSQLKQSKDFNLMFETKVGSISDSTSASYLRPETAQSIFINFKLVQDNARMQLPFGIAQTGKAFRNEISPRDFLFRIREFEMFEIEYFIHPDAVDNCEKISEVLDIEINFLSAEAQEKKKDHQKIRISGLLDNKLLNQWHAYWLGQFYSFFTGLGVREENLRIREHLKSELAHYSKGCFDIEYKFPMGWKEIHGCAYRTDFDLQQHTKACGKDMSYFDPATGKRVVPHVIEPSQGIERAMLAFLFEAYNEDKKRGNTVLGLDAQLSPISIGVFPLVNKLDNEAKKIYELLKSSFSCQFDRSGSIGRRYARADEIGIPFCVTVDFDTLTDNCVTVRDRNDTKQERVKIAELADKLLKKLA